MPVTTTQCDIRDMNYHIRDTGNYAGRPSVELSFGKKRTSTYTAKGVKAQLDRYGWTNRMRSGRTPLVFDGMKSRTSGGGIPYDPCYERFADAISALDGMLSSRLTIIDTRGVAEPVEAVSEAADYYTVYLSKGQLKRYEDETKEVWDWLAEQVRHGVGGEFVFEVEGMSDEGRLQDFQKKYKVPQDSIVLQPMGDTIEEVKDGFNHVEEIGKRNEWKVNPRIEFLRD